MINNSNRKLLKFIAITMWVALLGVICSRSLGIGSPGDDTPGDCPIQMVQNVHSSSDVQIAEIFLCEGLDENGIPINPSEIGKSIEWKEIYLCAFVTTSEPSSLSVYWFFEDGLEFTGMGVLEHVYHDGYVAFSLEKAASCTVNESNWAFPNYLSDEMEEGYIPAGEYHIEIHQGRKIIGEYSFFVEN